jgi:hypothetical protein
MGTGKTRLAQRETTSAVPALRPVLDLHDDIMVMGAVIPVRAVVRRGRES